MTYTFHPAMLKGPSNNPDPTDETLIVYLDTSEKLLQIYGFDGTDWAEFGVEYSVPTATVRPVVTGVSATRVATTAATFTTLRTLDLDEGDYSWSEFGTDSISGSNPCVSALSETRMAHYALFGANGDGRLQTLELSGGDWAAIGNQLEISDGTVGSRIGIVVMLTSTRIVAVDISSRALRTYDFDGSDWAQVGNTFSLGLSIGSKFSACRLGDGRIAYIDEQDDALTTFDFDGTDWSQTGNALSITPGAFSGGYALARLSDTEVALFNGLTRQLQSYAFDETDWSTLGNSYPVIATEPTATHLPAGASGPFATIALYIEEEAAG